MMMMSVSKFYHICLPIAIHAFLETFSAIYLAPVQNAAMPLIVVPHGGPHTAFANGFALETSFYLSLGKLFYNFLIIFLIKNTHLIF